VILPCNVVLLARGEYHGLARLHLTRRWILMRPLLNGATLGGPRRSKRALTREWPQARRLLCCHMARGVVSKRAQTTGVVVGAIAAVALVPIWRAGTLSPQSVQVAAGLLLVAVGLFALYQLATAESDDSRTHASKRAAALLYTGLVVLGVGNLLIESWIGVAVICVSFGFTCCHWVLRKQSSESGSP
jgi:hypothetical protein